jgi:hypothetical protein
MKKSLILLAGLAIAFVACHRNPTDSLIGTWTVEKVNVQFDERRSTPELVKQMGEMERQNVITISKDSVLTFKALDSDWQGNVCLKSSHKLYCDDREIGTWSEGQIVTSSDSPIGEVVVTYRKK